MFQFNVKRTFQNLHVFEDRICSANLEGSEYTIKRYKPQWFSKVLTEMLKRNFKHHRGVWEAKGVTFLLALNFSRFFIQNMENF